MLLLLRINPMADNDITEISDRSINSNDALNLMINRVNQVFTYIFCNLTPKKCTNGP